MVLLLIIGIALTGLACATLARVLVWPNAATRSAGVPKRVEAYGFEKGSEQKQETPGGVRGKLDEVATKLGAVVGDRSKDRSNDRIQKRSPRGRSVSRHSRALHRLPHPVHGRTVSHVHLACGKRWVRSCGHRAVDRVLRIRRLVAARPDPARTRVTTAGRDRLHAAGADRPARRHDRGRTGIRRLNRRPRTAGSPDRSAKRSG